jgi:hypothetical protein
MKTVSAKIYFKRGDANVVAHHNLVAGNNSIMKKQVRRRANGAFPGEDWQSLEIFIPNFPEIGRSLIKEKGFM